MIAFNPHHIFIQNKYPLYDTSPNADGEEECFNEGRHGDVPAQISMLSDDILDMTFS